MHFINKNQKFYPIIKKSKFKSSKLHSTFRKIKISCKSSKFCTSIWYMHSCIFIKISIK